MRERVAFAPEQVGEALIDACDVGGVEEVVILSTCNRTELYAMVSDGLNLGDKARELIEWVANYHHLSAQELHHCSYCHEGHQALRHLVQVASGLDSMVLGEPQIFGQLKSAYAVATDAGTAGGEFGRLFPRIFSIAKRVRTDTAIGENPVSVAYAAVNLAGHIFSDLGQCNALLVGAGETIELVARHLRDKQVGSITVANRTLSRAQELAADFSANAILLSDIHDHLPQADIVISSTASQLPVLGKGAVESALKKRRHKPMFMVDIAVPRDIEPEVETLDDVYLYTVDDLQEVIQGNLRARQTAADVAQGIIDQEADSWSRQQRSLAVVDTIRAFRDSVEKIRGEEVGKALQLLQRGQDAEAVIETLARNLTNKLMHKPTTILKQASEEGRDDTINATQDLFGLDKKR